MAAGGRRLFFALWPPAGVARAVAALARRVNAGGRPVAPERLHLTLAFHSRCDARAQAELCALGGAASATPLALSFDRLDVFAAANVLWLGMSQPPSELIALATHLRGRTVDRRPFVPHITLQRGIGAPVTGAVAPLAWTAHEFTLVESGANASPGAYRIVARWPLGTAGQL